MDVDDDCTPPRAVSKPCAVARMRTTRVSRAKNTKAVRDSIHVRTRNGAASTATTKTRSATADEPRGKAWTAIRRMGGSHPPYNDVAGWVYDSFANKMYMIGGSQPRDDDAHVPTADFYCCDINTMTWKNMTKSLRFRNPYSPFSGEERMRENRSLPILDLPGCTLMHNHGASFLFIVGGYDVDQEEASSRVVVVDLRHNEWWYLQLEGGPVNGRINPAVVVIDTKLYVFGGYRQYGDDPLPHNSYSIAEFRSADGTWHWDARDVEYSPLIPKDHPIGQATPIYNGTKILLTPGRFTDDNKINFTEDTMFSFHTERKRFQLVDVTGDFPRDVHWYSCFSNSSFSPTTPSVAPPRRPGRPRKTLTQVPIQMPKPAFSTSNSAPSVMICAWVPWPHSDLEEAVPEVWQLFLTPIERVDCLKISRKVYELDHDFQGVMMVGGRMLLMGRDPGVDDADRRTLVGPGDDSDEDKGTGAVWNIYFDLPLAR